MWVRERGGRGCGGGKGDEEGEREGEGEGRYCMGWSTGRTWPLSPTRNTLVNRILC